MAVALGVDTSILVRLITNQPEEQAVRCRSRLVVLAARGFEFVASNQVIGEAFFVLQHHYGVSSQDARIALWRSLQTDVVAAQGGDTVLHVLANDDGAGLLDRLIAERYQRDGVDVLTLDRRMAALPGVRLL